MLILASIILVILSIIFRIQAKTWLSPGAFFAGYWSLSVITPLLLAPDYFPIFPSAVWWIVASVLCLGIGEMVGKSSIRKFAINTTINLKKNTDKRLGGLNSIVILFTFIGMIGIFYYVTYLGYGIGVYFSFEKLKYISASNSNARYHGEVSLPIIYSILLCFTYSACYLGGVHRALNRSFISFAPFLPIIMTSVLTTSKAQILFPLFLWLAGWLSMKVHLNDLKISYKLVFRLSIIGTILTGIFIFLSMLRYQMFNMQGIYFIFERLTVYYFGYISGFSMWFTQSAFQLEQFGFGVNTFAGFFDLIGLSTRVAGIFSDSVYSDGFATNIYTIFRYLIQDWGLPGSLVLLGIIGFIAGIAFESTRRGSYMAISVLAMFYLQVLFSNTTSVFGYNTIIISSLIIFIYLGFNDTDFKKVKVTNKKFVLKKPA